MFDLVISRHESYDPQEVYRVLQTGGRFITQQVGSENCMDINRFLGEQAVYAYAEPEWSAATASEDLKKAGFHLLTVEEAFAPLAFYDVGALVFYLKVVSWQVMNFSVERYERELRAIHQGIEVDGEWVVREHRFFIEAQKQTE